MIYTVSHYPFGLKSFAGPFYPGNFGIRPGHRDGAFLEIPGKRLVSGRLPRPQALVAAASPIACQHAGPGTAAARDYCVVVYCEIEMRSSLPW